MSVVIVTGASRGLGLAISKLLIQLSANSKVVLVARGADAQQFIQLFPQTQQSSVEQRILAIAGDLTKTDVVKTVISKTLATFGRIDSIVINAGALAPVDHLDVINVDAMRQLFEINFFSAVELVKQAIPALRASKGNCLFVSSGASTKPYDGWLAYGSSKAALNHLSQDLAAEEGPDVRTVSIAPGVVDTEMQMDIRDKFGSHMDPAALQRFTQLHETGQLLPPEVPGSIFANLALQGIPPDLSGKYLRYNDPALKQYLGA